MAIATDDFDSEIGPQNQQQTPKKRTEPTLHNLIFASDSRLVVLFVTSLLAIYCWHSICLLHIVPCHAQFSLPQSGNYLHQTFDALNMSPSITPSLCPSPSTERDNRRAIDLALGQHEFISDQALQSYNPNLLVRFVTTATHTYGPWEYNDKLSNQYSVNHTAVRDCELIWTQNDSATLQWEHRPFGAVYVDMALHGYRLSEQRALIIGPLYPALLNFVANLILLLKPYSQSETISVTEVYQAMVTLNWMAICGTIFYFFEYQHRFAMPRIRSCLVKPGWMWRSTFVLKQTVCGLIVYWPAYSAFRMSSGPWLIWHCVLLVSLVHLEPVWHKQVQCFQAVLELCAHGPCLQMRTARGSTPMMLHDSYVWLRVFVLSAVALFIRPDGALLLVGLWQVVFLIACELCALGDLDVTKTRGESLRNFDWQLNWLCHRLQWKVAISVFYCTYQMFVLNEYAVPKGPFIAWGHSYERDAYSTALRSPCANYLLDFAHLLFPWHIILLTFIGLIVYAREIFFRILILLTILVMIIVPQVFYAMIGRQPPEPYFSLKEILDMQPPWMEARQTRS